MSALLNLISEQQSKEKETRLEQQSNTNNAVAGVSDAEDDITDELARIDNEVRNAKEVNLL